MTSSLPSSVYLLSPLSCFILEFSKTMSLDFCSFCFILFFIFILGELATCIALTVMTIQIACKPFFPPVLLLFPSMSQVGSLTWCLLIILSFQNRTLSTSLLFCHKWQEHYPSCHSDSVTQGYFFTLTFLMLHTSWPEPAFAPFLSPPPNISDLLFFFSFHAC